ncbi:EscU/YscU/HrcU family type III secretion system export apparatus switch protein [uncultured Sneathiella sp.]|jgi:flagellar biosynthesis protein|uniref:EscU/YscU/HrcU family type III secretion system export apparatus switch protein n=1 Tax=uncultured Sneathiella sp. TaxID=879315 RepID=UPI0030D81EC0|tara:strand:+ start:1275 stop:1559 length:285 start_codon:yes stop_codon:yes gene_type:complete
MTQNENDPHNSTDGTIAVALSYAENPDALARVTASGKGEVAEQILQLAFARGVKVRTDSDLAQILSEIEVDCPIPLEAFAAVSEILSYLYRCQD